MSFDTQLQNCFSTESNPDPDPNEQHLCCSVYSDLHACTAAYKPLLEPFGLTYPQYLVLLALWRKDFAADRNERSGRQYRIANEVPTLMMIGIVLMAVVEPF